MLAAPFFEQFGNEINSRLVGHHKTRLQLAAHPQRLCAKLLNRLRFSIIANINLPQILHIVNIEPHHMADSVRHKQCVGTCSHSLVNIAAHQPQSLQPCGQHLAALQMHGLIGDARLRQLKRLVIGIEHNLIYIALTLSELPTDGERAREVRRVAHRRFGASIDKHQPSRRYRLVVQMVMQCLAVLRQNGGERRCATVFERNAIDNAVNISLPFRRLHKAHRGGVHLVANGAGTLNLGNFFVRFHRPKVDYGLYQFERALAAHFGHRHSQIRRQRKCHACRVWRQIVDFAAFAFRFRNGGLKGAHRCRMLNSAHRRKIGNSRQWARPHHIVNVGIVAVKALRTRLKIDNRNQIRLADTEKIKERAVLTERVGVVGVVD